MKRNFALAISLLLLCWTAAARAQSVTVSGIINVLNRTDGKAKKSDNSNAAVWLTPIGGASRYEPIQARLVQHHKRFDPHLVIVPVGSVVQFPNEDPFFHNVFSLFDGKRFDLGLYEAGTTHSVQFDRPGVCYIFCNIHPEMSAVVVVVKTQYYALSNRAGEFTIPDVPSGRYLLSVWHERSQPDSPNAYPREVTISAANSSLGTIRLVESPDLMDSHKDKYGLDYEPPNPPNTLYEQP